MTPSQTSGSSRERVTGPRAFRHLRPRVAFLTILGGLAWASSPLVVGSVDGRWINVTYVVPLALLLVGLVDLWLHTEASPILGIGALITLSGILVAALGSVLQAAVSLATLAAWGIQEGVVFFAGLYLLFAGSLFLGVGRLRAGPVSWIGIASAGLFVLVLPLAFGGIQILGALGLTVANWVPFTVPYGLAWIVEGVYQYTSR